MSDWLTALDAAREHVRTWLALNVPELGTNELIGPWLDSGVMPDVFYGVAPMTLSARFPYYLVSHELAGAQPEAAEFIAGARAHDEAGKEIVATTAAAFVDAWLVPRAEGAGLTPDLMRRLVDVLSRMCDGDARVRAILQERMLPGMFTNASIAPLLGRYADGHLHEAIKRCPASPLIWPPGPAIRLDDIVRARRQAQRG